MLGLLAAAAHDVDHPGVNQPFLIKTNHHLANLYQVRELNVEPDTVWPTVLGPSLKPESYPWRQLHLGSASVMTTAKNMSLKRSYKRDESLELGQYTCLDFSIPEK